LREVSTRGDPQTSVRTMGQDLDTRCYASRFLRGRNRSSGTIAVPQPTLEAIFISILDAKTPKHGKISDFGLLPFRSQPGRHWGVE